MEKRKRRFGDRKDGRKLRSLDPLNRVANFIMPNRTGAMNMFKDSVDIAEIEKYIHRKRNEDDLAGFGIMHVLLAAYVRVVSQRPAVNRFISGQRVFARNDIEINLTVKQEMTTEGSETIIKIKPAPDATAEEIYRLMAKELEAAKTETTSSFDKTAKVLNYIPSVVLKFLIWFIKLLDYFGLLPRFLTDLSPFHGSLFITSMGSLGIPPVFHHLYDLGNVPAFIAFGAKERKLVLSPDGTVEQKRFIEYTVTTDERICDGYYFASALKYFKAILKNPSQLDARPETVIDDVE